jgi:prepilin-type N-terminal cleavage/methylation domain-containing protein
MRSADVRRPRRGFTLVELMVALVIGALLITITMRMVMGQTRFASVQSSREEVQQNARGAVEVVASELRGAIPAGLVLAAQDEVILMAPRHFGIACGTAGSDIVGIFPSLPLGVPMAPTQAPARWGLLIGTGAGWQGTTGNPTLNRITFSTVADFALGAAPPAPCETMNPEGGVRGLRFSGVSGPAAVSQGDVLVVYELVRFDVETTGGVSWLRRSNGWTLAGAEHGFFGHMQPLAGPVDPDAVRFTYLSGTPPTAMSFPVTGSAVNMVRFNVRTLTGRPLDGSIQQTQESSVTVHLRN